MFSYPGNIAHGMFLSSSILEMLAALGRAAGGRLLWSGFPGLDYFGNIVPGISWHPGNIGNVMFVYVCVFSPKKALRKITQNHAVMTASSLM